MRKEERRLGFLSHSSVSFLVGLLLFTLHSQSADAMLLSKPSTFAVRVVSYNVLSSHLASPTHFTTLDPLHLEASTRLPIIFKKLDDAISDKNTIVCLQELSHDWAAAFHTWFANRGYHLVTGLYGKKFNGYMGVAVAYPNQVFETIDMDIARLADKRIGGWPVAPEEEGGLWKGLQSLWKIPKKLIGWQESAKDHWEFSETRFNILVTATLRDKTSGKTFCIGNYHMPCAYYAPMVMTIHSEMAARHVQDIAGELPYVLAGDWNLTPDSPTYKLLTTGELPKEDASFPTPKYDCNWTPTIQAMNSAYAEFEGNEPDFTNYARVKEDDPFIGTLDYIFLSKEWKVVGTHKIPHRKDAGGPFPNETEPSDHVLISADLEL
jgi:mRNA deadenylase 3'-5' endonuclease subunit Ccr4